MSQPGTNLDLDLNPLPTQPVDISLPLIQQWIKPGEQHNGRRNPTQILRQQRRKTPIQIILRPTRIVLIKPLQRVVLEQIPLTKQQPRIMHPRSIGHRITQQLRLGRDSHRVRLPHRLNRQHRRQRGTRAVATKRNARTIQAEARSLFGQPGQSVLAILQRCRKAMLRRQSITDREHRTRRALAKLAADAVVGIQTANDKSATVEIHQHRQRRGNTAGPIQPQRQRRTIAGQCLNLADFKILRRRPAQLRGSLFEGGAGLARGQLVHGRQAGVLAVLRQVEKSFQIRV
ncbi:hypothetical protein SRABI89_03061 [Pseudomonas koreensis]|nr:hypothetical protein SRABI89_03061 [Pseudomonas koreensis]